MFRGPKKSNVNQTSFKNPLGATAHMVVFSEKTVPARPIFKDFPSKFDPEKKIAWGSGLFCKSRQANPPKPAPTPLRTTLQTCLFFFFKLRTIHTHQMPEIALPMLPMAPGTHRVLQ